MHRSQPSTHKSQPCFHKQGRLWSIDVDVGASTVDQSSAPVLYLLSLHPSYPPDSTKPISKATVIIKKNSSQEVDPQPPIASPHLISASQSKSSIEQDIKTKNHNSYLPIKVYSINRVKI